jgi:two-component system response regulator HydG
MNVPPLKDRGADILTLADFFLTETNEKLSKNINCFSKEVKKSFLSYGWPGNVFEQKNLIRRLALLTNGNQIGKTKPAILAFKVYPII